MGAGDRGMSTTVLAISGSLRKPSFTEKMLDLCIEGMGEGVEVHKFYPHQMDIAPCTGCWSCWGRKHPGECAQKDDFAQILEVYKRADVLLWAAPLYVFDFPATVKNVIDRLVVLLESSQVVGTDGLTEHPKRFSRHPKAVLISSCGFPDMENFDILRPHFRMMCRHMDWTWSGELLIPAAGASNAPKLFDRKYELLKRAGAELMEDAVSSETTDALAELVMPAEDYRRMATLSFERGLGAKARVVSIAVKAMRARKR
jgi:NAD(P)H-dependent FMN reductase